MQWFLLLCPFFVISIPMLDATCPKGYGGANCEICPGWPPSYKDTVGNAECTPCTATENTFVMFTNADGIEVYEGATSIEHCLCFQGWAGRNCALCPEGTRTQFPARLACESCENTSPKGYYVGCNCGPGKISSYGQPCQSCTGNLFNPELSQSGQCFKCHVAHIATPDKTGCERCPHASTTNNFNGNCEDHQLVRTQKQKHSYDKTSSHHYMLAMYIDLIYRRTTKRKKITCRLAQK